MIKAAATPIEPFEIQVEETVLSDLRDRIRRTRWPDEAPAPCWEQGTDREWLRRLLSEWSSTFDWLTRERELNRFAHFRAKIDDLRIHFVHEPARHGRGIPIILMHGWPSAFIEYLPLVPLLTDPASHGIDGPAFDVVIPSLPGYGYSERAARTGVNYRYVAQVFDKLMNALGYDRYGAAGGDFGAGVATLMALERPDRLIAIHLSNLELAPYLGAKSRPLSIAEQEYLEASEAWQRAEGGYKAVQSTKPQTLAYGLNDSPAGLAAWICEKWRSWSDCQGNIDSRFSRDFLLTLLMLYWVTGTITTSMRDYFDNRRDAIAFGPEDFVRTPTAVANFTKQFVFEGDPPREWAERLYNVRRWTSMPHGGHFAAAEEPEQLASDIAAFFADLS